MLVKKVKEFLKANNLINEDYAIVAVSTGVDSTVLLDILYKIGIKVVIAHVNHHKRKESDTEAKFIESYAKDKNIPFEILDYFYNHEGNFHDLAHEARYDFFRKLALKYHTNIIYTAHHADDEIETVLMKILEGSNLYGYGGISKINDNGEFKLVRPLLPFSKDMLYNYAKENNLTYFEDSSNNENDFLRNRIRHNVIPILKNESDDIYTKINEYSTILKESFEYIRNDSIKYLNEHENKINLDIFNKFHIALKKDIICLLLERYEVNKNNDIINAIINILSSKDGNKEYKLSNDYYFIKEYDMAFIKKKNDLIINECELGINDVVIYNNDFKIYFSKDRPINNAKYIKLCYNTLCLPLKVRPKKEGDSINLLIGNKKVSRLFIDLKIPKEKRDNIPIITDSNDNILWVYDYVKSKTVFEQKGNGDILLIVEEKLKNDER